MSDSINNQYPQYQITIEDLLSHPVDDSNDVLSKKEESVKDLPIEPLESVSVVDRPPPYEFASADSAPAYSGASVSARTPAPVRDSVSGTVTQQTHTGPDDSPILTRIPLRKYDGGECCCSTNSGKCCCLVLILIVILIILGVIAKVNNDACNNLNPNNEDKMYYSYDPNIYTNFSIDSSDSYIQ
ncbi:415_t:CDS:2, partial [Acaulospora colombiana]